MRARSAKTRSALDKGQRRDVQRRLTGLGFDTKVDRQVRRRDPWSWFKALAGRAGRLSFDRLLQQAAA